MEHTVRRRRLAREVLERYGTDRLLVAAASMMRRRPDEAEVNYTRAEMIAFIEALDEAGIRRLREAAAKVSNRRLH